MVLVKPVRRTLNVVKKLRTLNLDNWVSRHALRQMWENVVCLLKVYGYFTGSWGSWVKIVSGSKSQICPRQLRKTKTKNGRKTDKTSVWNVPTIKIYGSIPSLQFNTVGYISDLEMWARSVSIFGLRQSINHLTMTHIKSTVKPPKWWPIL